MSFKELISGQDQIFRIRSWFDSEPNATAAPNGRQIIDADPTGTFATAQIQLEEREDSYA